MKQFIAAFWLGIWLYFGTFWPLYSNGEILVGKKNLSLKTLINKEL